MDPGLDLAPGCEVYGCGVRISELAERVGVPTSTVRYYERVGLLPRPARTPSGYRDYDDAAATRLVFITRARRMGLNCDQIVDLLPIWDGTKCEAAHERVTRLVHDKRSEIAERIAELEQFAEQLDAVQATLQASTPPPVCRTDLSCCMPESAGGAVAVALAPRRSPHPAAESRPG
jgi:DNA-binding transcriptional MerR regulator